MNRTSSQSHDEARNPLGGDGDTYDSELTATAWHRRLFCEPTVGGSTSTTMTMTEASNDRAAA